MKYVLYHANCNDGFGAAFAAWKALGDEGVQYIPVNYQEPIPELENADEVYILDFSYPRDELLDLKSKVDRLVVIDHHKTAQENLAGLDFCIFNMEQSGAVLAWRYFHQGWGGPKHPEFFLYIQDRDLWQWKLPDSRAFSAGLNLAQKSFRVWDAYYRDGAYGIRRLIENGKPVLQFQNNLLDRICTNVNILPFADVAEELDFQLDETTYDSIAIINSPVLQSELGEKILKKYGNIAAVIIFHVPETPKMNEEKFLLNVSLRSRGDVDVSNVAKKYGGGGHKAAAGFTVFRE